MPRWMVTALPVFILLTACKMGPEYVRPDTQAEDAWRMAPASAESLANLPWWELLQDQELQKLIRTSLVENQDLRVAVASVEQFRAQLLISKFDLAPSLGYQAGGLTFHNTNNQALTFGEGISIPNAGGTSNGGTDFSYLSGMVGLKWEIDLWGRIRRSIEAAQAQLLSQEENQRAVVLGLVGSVAEAYFDLRALDLQTEITKRTLKAWTTAFAFRACDSSTAIFRNSIWTSSRRNARRRRPTSPNSKNRWSNKRITSACCWVGGR